MAEVTTNKPASRTSAVVQNFLSETYLEASESSRVSLRALAARLGVTPPAVSRMAQRLVRQGLVRREGACGLVLSEAGERIALRAIRKRRIFEVFLIQKLGYTWDEVYPVAAAASNYLDDELIERMNAQLGHPTRCPHGDPIPSRDGRIQPLDDARLSELANGVQGVVSRVSSHDSDLLRYLSSLNIKPGMPIHIVSRAPFSGPLRVRVANGNFYDEHVIGSELASKVWVEVAR
ncbi:MAG: metal-dependent transcriptional regulator [Chloroflexi bacterium]|jgi:DtxR family Mn-dependent transcriptional regulator|uniref:DtxR family transcriptional regulator n=1 Tax=Candidatus Thermofonsia Clade 3 bacterium TaxID=2364212 RepID=A0A2M8QGZ5_9CHLR|nr:metal-dependent transcriptional regulator [Candidatus Roseilinea sp. NK_OTU-006]PJF49080.1 MAG: DtxR family transcriptional regulator [Candidatus Thermofonsia Clade 3 bacterium]RMG62732.1 MAG: metal-dependent transcriptional regulator [Chloroflexota bacterium]